MAVAPRAKHWRDRDVSPERTKVWIEPKTRSDTDRKVPVVYYLSRNGHLEHPHFMEVPITSDGLYLKDVINRLNLLRGKGMATMYSWSSKRSYKNGFVWHDLSDEDFIHPAHGHEYVLKGSELLTAPSPPPPPPETPKSVQDDSDLPPRRKSPLRWKSLDLNEYKVYKNELTAADATSVAADASTQTDERRQRQRRRDLDAAVEEEENQDNGREEIEISPPQSSSSPETLETLIRADGRLIRPEEQPIASLPSGRIRASTVLMQLISCGSLSIKEQPEISMVASYRRSEMERLGRETPMFLAPRPEDRDYFSGSLIETKKAAAVISDEKAGEFPGLKRSSSYNADRSSKLEGLEKEVDGVRAKCIPRKPKATPARKEGNPPVSRSTHGSKRITNEPARNTEKE